MNQRSRLIPVIAKSMTSILEKSDNDFARRRQQACSLGEGEHINITDSSPSRDPRTTIKQRLWKIAQRNLYYTLGHSAKLPCSRLFENDIPSKSTMSDYYHSHPSPFPNYPSHPNPYPNYQSHPNPFRLTKILSDPNDPMEFDNVESDPSENLESDDDDLDECSSGILSTSTSSDSDSLLPVSENNPCPSCHSAQSFLILGNSDGNSYNFGNGLGSAPSQLLTNEGSQPAGSGSGFASPTHTFINGNVDLYPGFGPTSTSSLLSANGSPQSPWSEFARSGLNIDTTPFAKLSFPPDPPPYREIEDFAFSTFPDDPMDLSEPSYYDEDLEMLCVG